MVKNYKDLYFKYKLKYLSLRNSIGGSSISSNSNNSSFISDDSSFISGDSSLSSATFFDLMEEIWEFIYENQDIFDISSSKSEYINENGNNYTGFKLFLKEDYRNIIYFFFNDQLPNNLDLRINDTNYSNLYVDDNDLKKIISLALYEFDNEKYKDFNILNLYLKDLMKVLNDNHLVGFRFLIESFKESEINNYKGYKVILRRTSDNKDYVLNFFYSPVLSIKVQNNNIESFQNIDNSILNIINVIADKIKYVINNELS